MCAAHVRPSGTSSCPRPSAGARRPAMRSGRCANAASLSPSRSVVTGRNAFVTPLNVTCRMRPREVDRIRVAEVDVRLRIGALTVAGAQHRLLAEPIRGAQARQELARSEIDARVQRHAVQPSRVDVAIVRIEARHADVAAARRPRVILPAQAEVDGQVARDRPLILHVGGVRLHVDGVRVAELFDLAGAAGQSEQEVRPAVEARVRGRRGVLQPRGSCR